MPLTRRRFLAGAAAGATLAAIGLGARAVLRTSRLSPGRYGPLRPDPARLLDLPEGFSYRVLQRRGEPMSDGHRVPGLPDAMACFPGPAGAGTLILTRNHEVLRDRAAGPLAPGQAPLPVSYDPDAHGGVTRLVVDAATLEPRASNLVLAGTARNCAGGPSPWGWLSCEETVTSGHGFVFLCDPHADGARPPQRLDALGRMNHEAAAVDPRTSVIYLSEDRDDGCLYRFRPDAPAPAAAAAPPAAGRLQALAVRGRPGFDLATRARTGDRFELGWVDLSDPVADEDLLRARARAAGAALVRRGEGLWWHDDAAELWLVSTTGGARGAGQIFRLRADGDAGELELLAQSQDSGLCDMPDNLAISPWGEAFLCEDGPGGNHLRVLDASGRLFDFARNARSHGEFAGVCFAPDGGALFVNLQQDGLTLAVIGPFTTPEEAVG